MLTFLFSTLITWLKLKSSNWTLWWELWPQESYSQDFFFFTASLRYKLHAINFIHSECKSQSFLVTYSHAIPPQPRLEYYHHPEFPCAHLESILVPLLSDTAQQTISPFPRGNFFLWTSHTHRYHIICNLLHLAFLTQQCLWDSSLLEYISRVCFFSVDE